MSLYFDEQFINEVKDKNDIVDVISHYVSLKRNGNRYIGLCPFHSERTPSFSVSPEQQLYHCFGCGAGGTVIHFIQNIENLDFIETIKYLADRAGIAIPENQDFSSENSKLKKNILEMNKIAGRSFFRNLNSEAGKTALSYLRNRGLSDDTIKSYGLGYAKNSWDACYSTLKDAGFSDKDILKSGLCAEKNGKIYDFFRDRVMFPVMDIRGNVIAFGGRVLGDGTPKYLNTGETLVFSKKQNLYSLNIAKNKSEDYIILCEGYMDVIALYQAGFKNAVASLGTAFCEEHSRLLKRYCDKIIISFDSDNAGLTAAKKAVEILKKDGLTVRILKMVGAKDPDELIKKFGKEAYVDAINNAMSGTDYELSQIFPKNGFIDEEDRVSYVKNAIGILKDIDSILEKELYIKKVSEISAISVNAITAQVKKARNYRKYEKSLPFSALETIKRKGASQSLLKLIIENPSYFSKIRGKINSDIFKEEIHKKIYDTFVEIYDTGQKIDVSMVLTRLDNQFIKEATEIFIEREPYIDFNIYFESLLGKINSQGEKPIFNSNSDDKDDILKLLEYTKKLKKS
jgi:DNA primase